MTTCQVFQDCFSLHNFTDQGMPYCFLAILKLFPYSSRIHKLIKPYMLECNCLLIFQTKRHQVHALSKYAKINWLFSIYIAKILNEMDNYIIYTWATVGRNSERGSVST